MSNSEVFCREVFHLAETHDLTLEQSVRACSAMICAFAEKSSDVNKTCSLIMGEVKHLDEKWHEYFRQNKEVSTFEADDSAIKHDLPSAQDVLDSKGILADCTIAPMNFTFNGVNQGPILEFKNSGDIYVHGRLVTNDMEVVEGIKEWLRVSKVTYNPPEEEVEAE